jgi:hypothetical protein
VGDGLGPGEASLPRPLIDVLTYDLLSSGDSLIDLQSLNSVKITRGTPKAVLSGCLVIIFGRGLPQVH